AGGANQAATAQAKYKQALADMTPAARGTFNAFLSLRKAFTAWRGIQTAALWAWNVVLKPTFAALMVAVRFVGRVAMWLWHNV
ncbi:hypothetical protein KBZ21_40205, partial [Streptomyces sp. A73]|nr:hypothetical protein [Streptomyces sp. A73]